MQAPWHASGTAVHERQATAEPQGRAAACPRRPARPRRERGASPLAVGTEPARTAGSAGSSSCTIRSAPGTRRRTSATCAAAPSASEAGQVGDRAGVGERGLDAAGQLRPPRASTVRTAGSSARPGTRPPLPPARRGPRRASPRARPRSRPRRSASRQPRGRRLDRQVDQQGRAAADQVGAGPAGRQLGQERQVRQLAEDDAERLARVGARHRADAGRALRRPGKRHRMAHRDIVASG